MTHTFSVFTSNGGHSSQSPGASGCGFKEHEQTRLCNAAFITAMQALGYQVRDTTSDAGTKQAVLREQVGKANTVHGGAAQLDISWHLNAGGGTGVEVYYYSDDMKADAARISAVIAKTLGIKDRGAKQNQLLYFLKHTQAKALLIEACFIDCASDMAKLKTMYNKVGQAVALELVDPFVPSASNTVQAPKPYTGSSLVDYLKSLNIDSSFSNRARLAVSYGICTQPSHYHGTYAQNYSLLKAMRGEKR